MINHVAFIMDGNRRWAKENRFSFFVGHENGTKQIEPLVEHAISKGIHFLTFWAFSTENWKRSKAEVTILMEVFRKTLNGSMVQRLKKNNVRIQTIGNITRFPDDIQKQIQEIVADTEKNNRITVTLALNYGGREEILMAAKRLLQDKPEGEIDEKMFSSYLYSNAPDPDLIIRTGGEQRLSGYLPWQSVYSELYFSKVFWPDFSEKEFEEALKDFEKRKRRYGQ